MFFESARTLSKLGLGISAVGLLSLSTGVITLCMLSQKKTNQHQIHTVFANCSEEDVIYPLTVKEIALAQEDDLVLKKVRKTDKYSTQLV